MKDHHKPNQIVTSMTAAILDTVSLLNNTRHLLGGTSLCLVLPSHNPLFLLLRCSGGPHKALDFYSPVIRMGNFLSTHFSKLYFATLFDLLYPMSIDF